MQVQQSTPRSKGTLVQFGAGNIGRSFIGQLFSRGGYEVVFIDIDPSIVEALNREHAYRVIVKNSDGREETIAVDNVRAVDGRDAEAVTAEIADAAYVATSVGKNALPHIMPVLARGIETRDSLDIIIAENIRDGAALFTEKLTPLLPAGFPFAQAVGLVETSIGKMVPIMTAEDKAHDPLAVFAEPYNTLIVDRHGFRTGVPDIPNLHPVDNITAYVDRKLFIHNMGHAAAAYLGFRAHPEARWLWEVLEDAEVLRMVRGCMVEAACALNAEYPQDLPYEELMKHIDDLLRRFQNRSLQDTIHRVGRDLYRKLGYGDRLIGAIRLAQHKDLPYACMATAVAAARTFAAPDESGEVYPRDLEFAKQEAQRGLRQVLSAVCGLNAAHPEEAAIIENIMRYDRE